MASLDDLVKATRSRRVQVSDLAAAPKLQPTIRSGGQYTVAVQQAGRNKLLDLADALKQVNPILKEYGGIADIQFEKYQQELQQLKPEQLQAELKKTTDEFDKMSRQGGFAEWLVSPVNEVRKRRALGKAAHDQFVQGLISSEGRLNKPQEGDDKLTTAQIMQQEFDKFVEENPALQGQYANEGFTAAVNPTILQLTNRYDQQKAEQSKRDTLLGNTSAIFRAAKNATLGSTQYAFDMFEASDAWAELNAFTPAQQLKVIENVATELARLDGGERKASAFLTWAQSNLKVGNALFETYEDQVNRFETIVAATADAADELRDSDRDERIDLKTAEFGVLLNKIQRGEEVTYGTAQTPIKTREQLVETFQKEAEQDSDILYQAGLSREVEKAAASDYDPNAFVKREITKNAYTYNTLGTQVQEQMKLLSKNYTNVMGNAPGSWRSLTRDIFIEVKSAADAEMERLINTGQAENPQDAAAKLDGFVNDKLTEYSKIAENRALKLQDELTKETAQENEYNELKKPSEDPMEAATENILFDEDVEDIVEKSYKNLKLLANAESSKAERKKAKDYNDKFLLQGLKEAAAIATGSKKKIKYRRALIALREGLEIVEPDKRYGFDKSLVKVAENVHTFEEMEEAQKQYFQLARAFGTFTDLNTLKQGVTNEGIEFDVKKDLNPQVTVLIKAERLRQVKDIDKPEDMPDDIKEVADLVGAEDYLKFLRQQINLQKLLFDSEF